jgi:hypothetical protein
MDTLFTIEPTKPTKLQAARRALADAEEALKGAQWLYNDLEELVPYDRAVERCAEIVKQEESAELNNSKKNI